MTIKVECACGKMLSVKDDQAGEEVKCPACQKPLSIPNSKVEEGSLDHERDSDEKGTVKKSSGSNRGLVIGLSVGGGVCVVALLTWVLWPSALQRTLTLKGHTGYVKSVVFSPDGQRLASVGGDYGKPYRAPFEVKVWDVTPTSQ